MSEALRREVNLASGKKLAVTRMPDERHILSQQRYAGDVNPAVTLITRDEAAQLIAAFAESFPIPIKLLKLKTLAEVRAEHEAP